MTPVSTRLIRLLNMVPYFQANPRVTRSKAAADLGVSAKQLEEDLNQLWMCGLPGYFPGDLIDFEFSGDTIEVTFSAGIDRPLKLTSPEATGLLVALRALADIPGVVDPEAARSAIAKIEDAAGAVAHDASHAAGKLCPEWAAKLGLPAGIPIAIGEMDVHYGAIGCGVKEGTLVKVIGTSTCDCGVVSAEKNVPDIPGICGIVPGAILPGFYGLEAGQSAVGDIFKWWVEVVCKGDSALHLALTKEAEELRPGQSGQQHIDLVCNLGDGLGEGPGILQKCGNRTDIHPALNAQNRPDHGSNGIIDIGKVAHDRHQHAGKGLRFG